MKTALLILAVLTLAGCRQNGTAKWTLNAYNYGDGDIGFEIRTDAGDVTQEAQKATDAGIRANAAAGLNSPGSTIDADADQTSPKLDNTSGSGGAKVDNPPAYSRKADLTLPTRLAPPLPVFLLEAR